MNAEDRPKTAFITADSLYQFRVLQFGLKAAPSYFQRTMDIVLGSRKWTSCLTYIDDILVYAPTFNEYLHRLQSVLECLRRAVSNSS